MAMKPRNLADRSRACIICHGCGTEAWHTRDVPSGFSYLEVVENETYECTGCGGSINIVNPYLFSFVMS